MAQNASLGAYRALLRQIHKTFNGDMMAIKKTSFEAKAQFLAHKGLTDPKEISARVADAQDATAFIRDNIVQAKKSKCGTYEVAADQAHKLKDLAPEITSVKGDKKNQ